MAESNVTLAIADGKKAVERLEKLVAKRTEMLEAAYKLQADADHRVSRREEILAEHQALLDEARRTLAANEATATTATEEATTA